VIKELIEAVDALRRWVFLYATAKRIEQQMLIDAMIEIHSAANKTRFMIGETANLSANSTSRNRRANQERVRAIQGELSQVWQHVAQTLLECHQRYSSDPMADTLKTLYDRCFAKAGHWANPSISEANSVDIELSRLVQDVAEAIETIRTRY
jgi:hypothetical protein